MGCAPMAHALFSRVINYHPNHPDWWNRDRFVLSNGHACTLQYAMLHLTGYKQPTLEDCRNFRQLGSVTAGHPENTLLPGVEVSTGPLGQGLTNAVGMAIASTHLAATYNRADYPIFDNHVFAICGDGCLQEGVTSEASSLAGHLGLGRLICLWDDNHITIDGKTELSFTEDVAARYSAYGWHVQTVRDGDNDFQGIVRAIEAAKLVTDKPSLIQVTTTIGYGSKKQGTHSVHGSPLGEEEIRRLKVSAGQDPDACFCVPEAVQQVYRESANKGRQAHQQWETMFAKYCLAYPKEAEELKRRIKGELPCGLQLPRWSFGDKAVAARSSSETVLNAVAQAVPELFGGSADLTPSNKTAMHGISDFQADSPGGRYLRFGVREHAMAAVCNGIAAYGGFIPYCATFLNFAGYALGAIRVCALSRFQVIYVMTHDSICLGEDGPTHQPTEMLACLRAMPNHLVFRPADANEVAGAWQVALASKTCPSTLALSRQNLPCLEYSCPEQVSKGAYVVQDAKDVNIILLATGSEVSLAIEATKELKQARVVSMPCWELFDQQSLDYRLGVLTLGVPILSIEAATSQGWGKYSHAHIGVTNKFGESGKGQEVYEHFGFTVSSVVSKANELLMFFKDKQVPSLQEMPRW
jgi:transketolase